MRACSLHTVLQATSMLSSPTVPSTCCTRPPHPPPSTPPPVLFFFLKGGGPLQSMSVYQTFQACSTHATCYDTQVSAGLATAGENVHTLLIASSRRVITVLASVDAARASSAWALSGVCMRPGVMMQTFHRKSSQKMSTLAGMCGQRSIGSIRSYLPYLCFVPALREDGRDFLTSRVLLPTCTW